MKKDAFIFLIILILNTVITILYWLFFKVYRKRNEGGYTARCIVMLLCPIVGPVYFALGWVFRKIFFHKPVDLTDVIFSKDREEILLKADEYGESNIVPVDDAVSVFDKENARTLMLRVLRTDVRRSLGSISAGLDSSDSEISHYAASMMQSELGKFRTGIQKTAAEIDRIEAELREEEKEDGALKTPAGKEFSLLLSPQTGEETEEEELPTDSDLEQGEKREERRFFFADVSGQLEASEDYNRHEASAYEQGMRAFYGDEQKKETTRQKLQTQAEAAHSLIEDTYAVLKQNVLSDLESARFTELLDRMAHLMEKRDMLSETEMACVAECHLLRGDYEKCRAWCDQLSLVYPEALEAFSTKLKLLYNTGEREAFFEVLDQMKKTGVPLDHEMMEMVRCFL